MDYKIPLLLTPQPEGGYTVTSPLLPELVTEGDSLSEATDLLLAIPQDDEEIEPPYAANFTPQEILLRTHQPVAESPSKSLRVNPQDD